MDEGDINELTIAYATFATAVAHVNEQNHNVAMAVAAHRSIQSAIVSSRCNERRKRKGTPYVWVFPWPETSWLDHTLYDMTIPEKEFKQRLRLCQVTFWLLLIFVGLIKRTQIPTIEHFSLEELY